MKINEMKKQKMMCTANRVKQLGESKRRISPIKGDGTTRTLAMHDGGEKG
jgi:hypothetical protein